MKHIKYHDTSALATDPLSLSLDRERLKKFRGEFGWRVRLSLARIPDDYIEEHLNFGDSRAAMVVRKESKAVVVAAYTDESDAVVLLRFPIRLLDESMCSPGLRLVTINTYFNSPPLASDIVPGSGDTGSYFNFYPIIAEFLSGDADVIEQRRNQIGTKEWDRVAVLGHLALENGQEIRSGNPFCSKNAP